MKVISSHSLAQVTRMIFVCTICLLLVHCSKGESDHTLDYSHYAIQLSTEFDPASRVEAPLKGAPSESALASNASESLIVWRYQKTIRGVYSDENGIGQHLEFVIAQGNHSITSPVIASDGVNFLVLWAELHRQHFIFTGVLINSNHEMHQLGEIIRRPALTGVDEFESHTSTLTWGGTQPITLIWGGTGYLLAWTEAKKGGGGESSDTKALFACRLTAQTVSLDGDGIELTHNGELYDFTCASDGTNYLVLYITKGDDYYHSNISGSIISPSSGVLDENFPILTTDALYHRKLIMAVGGDDQYLLLWGGYKEWYDVLRCIRLNGDGRPIDVNEQKITTHVEISSMAAFYEAPSYTLLWTSYDRLYFTSIDSATGAQSTDIKLLYEDPKYWLHQLKISSSNHVRSLILDRICPQQEYYSYYSNMFERLSTTWDGSGTLGPMESYARALQWQRRPSIAASDDMYILTWLDSRDNCTNYEDVYGLRIGDEDKRIDKNDIPISVQSYEEKDTRVASNGETFLSVWIKEDPSGHHFSMQARLFTNDGEAINPSPIPIYDIFNMYLSAPAVASNGTKYLVAWLQDANTDFYPPYKINGVFIGSNGSLEPAKIFTLALSQPYTIPALTSDGDNYWLCYQKHNHLFVREIFSTGELGEEKPIMIVKNDLAELTITPLSNKGKLLITWVQSDFNYTSGQYHYLEQVKAALVNTTYSMKLEASYTFSVQQNRNDIASVAAATDGNVFCTVWREGLDTIRAAIILPDGSLLYKKSFNIVHNEDGVSNPTIASRRSGEFLIAYDEFDLSPEFKARRIRARRLLLTPSD